MKPLSVIWNTVFGIAEPTVAVFEGQLYASRLHAYAGDGMKAARVFQSGNSPALRLPKEFHFKGKEVEIFRRGNEVVLREKGQQFGESL